MSKRALDVLPRWNEKLDQDAAALDDAWRNMRESLDDSWAELKAQERTATPEQAARAQRLGRREQEVARRERMVTTCETALAAREQELAGREQALACREQELIRRVELLRAVTTP